MAVEDNHYSDLPPRPRLFRFLAPYLAFIAVGIIGASLAGSYMQDVRSSFGWLQVSAAIIGLGLQFRKDMPKDE